MFSPDAPFFEGTEKKIELVVDSSTPSLRGLGEEFWTRIVRVAGADIVSRISSKHCDAYLLSESSLFVFDHKAVMMTCGCTVLHRAVLELFHTVPPERLRLFVYERKNEVFPHSQPTSFFEDVKALKGRLPGVAYQLGEEDEHHLYLFHLDRDFPAEPGDTTLEVLMHGIDDDVRKAFNRTAHLSTRGVREATGLDRVIEGFEVDDHLFEPGGYSLNALRDDEYYAVHVTPEEICSYASFETNHRFKGDPGVVVGRVLDAFRPRSFDLVLFEQGDESRLSAEGYRLRSHVAQDLVCGYRVRFMSFYRPQQQVRPAIELPVP